jgi:hypothetical protein
MARSTPAVGLHDPHTLDARTIVQEFKRPAIEERRARQRAATGAAAPDAREQRNGPRRQRPRRSGVSVLDEARGGSCCARLQRAPAQAVLTDAWFNHFNVFAGKGPTRSYVTA